MAEERTVTKSHLGSELVTSEPAGIPTPTQESIDSATAQVMEAMGSLRNASGGAEHVH